MSKPLRAAVAVAHSSVTCRCTATDQQDKAFLYFMIPFAVLMAVAVPIIVLWTRMSLPKYVGRWNRKKGPPESGHTVTLVLTDVEGSTELWEAFQEVRETPCQGVVQNQHCMSPGAA